MKHPAQPRTANGQRAGRGERNSSREDGKMSAVRSIVRGVVDIAGVKPRMVRQVVLSSGVSLRTCWVPDDPKLAKGSRITLKNSDDPDRLWTVTMMSHPRDAAEIHSDWNVGGVTSRR